MISSPKGSSSASTSCSSLERVPTTATSSAGTAGDPSTLLGALLDTSAGPLLAAGESQASPSTSIQPSSESQSGNAETEHASDLILSHGLSETSSSSSASSSVSDSQNAASSVLLGDTHLALASPACN